MTNVVTPGLAVTYIHEQARAIIGRSAHGDDFIHLKYMRNGMRLSIMPRLTSSRFAAHPHCHQRQVRRPHQHEGVHPHQVVPPWFVLVLPLAPLPFGWELATIAEGTPYYLDNRGITTWECPELHPYPTAPPKPPKHEGSPGCHRKGDVPGDECLRVVPSCDRRGAA